MYKKHGAGHCFRFLAFVVADAQSCTFCREAAEHKKLETAMQKAKEQFTAFERQDAKMREEVKHITSKMKKLAKQTEVRIPVVYDVAVSRCEGGRGGPFCCFCRVSMQAC